MIKLQKTKTAKLSKHDWEPLKESKGVWGYHVYRCKRCGEETHIGLDRDYEALECPKK